MPFREGLIFWLETIHARIQISPKCERIHASFLHQETKQSSISRSAILTPELSQQIPTPPEHKSRIYFKPKREKKKKKTQGNGITPRRASIKVPATQQQRISIQPEKLAPRNSSSRPSPPLHGNGKSAIHDARGRGLPLARDSFARARFALHFRVGERGGPITSARGR